VEPRPTLSTERLYLRWLTPEDAAFMLRIWNDPTFVRYVGDRGLRTEDDARQALSAGPLTTYERYGYGPYLVCLQATGRPAGICGLFRRQGLDDPDIGYALLPEYRGLGLAREAADAVIEHARVDLGLTRLTAIVAADNASSLGLIQRLGLSFERMISLPGEDEPACLYGVDWQTQPARPLLPDPDRPTSPAGRPVGWRELREFAGVDMDRSFVVSWSLDRDLLSVDVDLRLRPEHPFYEQPRRREKDCMRPAVIEFPCCAGIRLDGSGDGGDPQSVVLQLEAGAITDLERRDEGPYVLRGHFGIVEIDAERPILRLGAA
jgi:RimJ/RimL family protein N-acetyltransferase